MRIGAYGIDLFGEAEHVQEHVEDSLSEQLPCLSSCTFVGDLAFESSSQCLLHSKRWIMHILLRCVNRLSDVLLPIELTLNINLIRT